MGDFVVLFVPIQRRRIKVPTSLGTYFLYNIQPFNLSLSSRESRLTACDAFASKLLIWVVERRHFSYFFIFLLVISCLGFSISWIFDHKRTDGTESDQDRKREQKRDDYPLHYDG